MKSLFFLFIIVNVLIAGQLNYSIEFNSSELSEYQNRGYTRLQLPDCQSFGLPGEPLLPVRVVALVIEPGAENITVSSVLGESQVLNVTGMIQPTSVPRPFSAVASTLENIQKNAAIYNDNQYWPLDRIRNIRTGSKSGYTILSFFVYPYRYNPVLHKIEFCSSVDVTVNWTAGSSVYTSQSQQESASAQLVNWIDNPEYLTTYSPVLSGRDATDYLVISSSDYSDSFSSFVTFKNAQGFVTEFIDIADILISSSGYDDAEKLRNYIKERYNNDGIQHVLLAGDQTIVPVRMVNLSCEGYTDNVPVDLYFSDLDGSWDANGDHNYGQTNDDLDLYADISVGRALFDSTDEAALFVERTIAYESTAPSGDWQTTAMLCGAGLFTGYTGAKVCDSIAVNLPGSWDIYKAYETARSSDGFTTPIDVINDGANWVHYAGHGNTGGIYWQSSPTQMMTNSIAQGLINGEKAGIHHSIACMPGAFQSGECCAEALVHNGNGGAVSVMFNTSYGWEGNVPEMGVSEWMCVYLTEEVFQNGNNLIGEAFATSKDRRVPLWTGGYDRELYCILDWHGFHDPTLIPLDGSTGIENSSFDVIQSDFANLTGPFPNPVEIGSSIVFSTSFTTGVAEITVFDTMGRQVFTEEIENVGTVMINTNTLQTGVYFVRLKAGLSIDTVKMVVIN